MLATFHEGMHAEALAYTRQTLGYAAPRLAADPTPRADSSGPFPGDVDVAGGIFAIGAHAGFALLLSTTKSGRILLRSSLFASPRAPVTNGEFLAFVEAGGYRECKFWSTDGWQWLQSGGAPQLENTFAKFFNNAIPKSLEPSASKEPLEHPVYWSRQAQGRWQQRLFDRTCRSTSISRSST